MISITDGQIYLESDLFYAGIRPAINVGLSVSRVGGNAQTKAMKQVAGSLRLALAQYRELAAFAQLSTELDKATQEQLTRGERMTEILKQDILEPVSLSQQVMIIFSGNEGLLDDLPLGKIKAFEKELLIFLEKNYAAIGHEIETKKVLSDELKGKLKSAIQQFEQRFKK